MEADTSLKRINSKISIFLTILLIFLSSMILTSCSGEDEIDFDSLISVTYDCMGGNIDKLPTRTLLSQPNSLIIEPKGTSGFVEPKKVGYTLEGWYTDYISGDFTLAEEGEYVYANIYSKDLAGSYVGIPNYYLDNEGDYVGKEVVGSEELVYELFNAEDETHELLNRYGMFFTYELYDEENEAHDGYQRYSAELDYSLYDERNPEHEGLAKYMASLTFNPADKWDFATNKISDQPLVLYAKWVKNLLINWIYNNGSDTVVTFQNGVLGTVINRGEIFEQTAIVPKKNGYTFTYWYKDIEGTDRWDFNTDVFPTDEAITKVDLFAGYVEGDYERILDINDLRKIAYKTSGSFLLLNDLVIEDSFVEEGTIFSGVFNGYGHNLTGLSMLVYNNTKLGTPKAYGLFSYLENATIENLTISIEFIVSESSIKPLKLGALAGEDLGGSLISNCYVDTSMSIENRGTTQSDLYVGAFVGLKAQGDEATLIENSEYNDARIWSLFSEGIITYAD